MTGHAVLLEDMERDALTELVNIGVSRAAANLRKMVGQQVLLSVPSLEVVTRTGACHVQNVGASLLEAVGLGDLVASDFEGYAQRVVALAADAGVAVLQEQVVGPYETVQLKSSDSGALKNWLIDHNYNLSPDISPVIDAYVPGATAP